MLIHPAAGFSVRLYWPLWMCFYAVNCAVKVLIVRFLYNRFSNNVIFSPFYFHSLSFPPKPYAATENSYAPSSVTLLILATRTGTCCGNIEAHWSQTSSIKKVLATNVLPWQRQPLTSACTRLVELYTLMPCSSKSSRINHCNHGWALIWLDLNNPGTIFTFHRFNLSCHS